MIGDILLVRNHTFFGKLIRKTVNCDYNHVGMFIDDDNQYLVEAKMRGVEQTHISHFHDLKAKGELDFIICRFKQMAPSDREIMKKFLQSKIGSKYDFVQLLLVGLYVVLGLKRVYPPLDIRRCYMCSELLGETLNEVNQTFQPNIHYENTTPADIQTSPLLAEVLQ